ncbi:MAG: hypothetical protein IT406_03770 [Candidatus Yanofskybacteria bacterium]|nr:hypothetical protein [Candidatus Yanofskybacteria bacterium]
MRELLRDRRFLHATAVLVGTMVGVGIYGIPFAFAKAGFWVGALWLLALGGVMALSYLLFAELVLSTQGIHQVSGYANIWLGAWGRRLMTAANVLGIYGALLAYLIVAGEFLHNILSQFFGVDPQLYSILFALGWSLLWLARARTMAGIELALIGVYTGVIGIIAAVGIPHIDPQHFLGWTPELWYLPYGVVLFALAGMTAVPIQRQLLVGRERLMRPAIITATVVAAVLYLLFALVVVGVSGDVTSPEALAGLFGFMGTPIIILGSILGVLTISTSYVVLGTALYETFHIDYRVSPLVAWLTTLIPPVLLFISGLRNFIDVIGLVGAVSVGIQGVLILGAYLRARRMRLRAPEIEVRIPSWAVWVIMLILTAGVLYELLQR